MDAGAQITAADVITTLRTDARRALRAAGFRRARH